MLQFSCSISGLETDSRRKSVYLLARGFSVGPLRYLISELWVV